jgi:xanthine dehydrogenase small subunit
MQDPPETVFILNDAEVRTALPAGTVLLDFIRNDRRLTGTREGCREGDCGACTVLLGTPSAGGVCYRAVNSCLFPLADAAGRHVVTIEGLNPDGHGPSGLTPVQQAIVSEGASQCGFCTPGIVVSLTGFLLRDEALELDDAVTAIEGNVCRCTGYASIRRAVARLLNELRPRLANAPDRLRALVELGVVPAFMAGVAERLRVLQGERPAEKKKRDAVVVGGGTDLFVQRGRDLAGAELLLLSRQEGFTGVWPSKERIFIGAATPVATLMEAPLLAAVLPDMAGALRLVSSAQIRGRATVGGNIVNASPIGDLSVILLALGAAIGLRAGKKSRERDLAGFFLGYKKLDLRPGEVAAWIGVPLPRDGFLFHFEKVSRRRYQDIASVNSAIGLEMTGGRIVAARASAGGVAPVPLLLRRASAFLAGKAVSPGVVREFLSLAMEEIAPISDVRGSAAYKQALLRRLLFAHFLELFPGPVGAGRDGPIQAGDLP